MKRFLTRLFSALLAVAALSSAAFAQVGYVVPMGGSVRPDNAEIWQRLVDLAGGKGAKYVVFATASENPQSSGSRAVETLNRYGADAELIPVSPRWPGRDVKADVRDATLIAKVKAARGVFFTGGAQERIVDAFLLAEGKKTPMLEAIWAVLESGGVVAGSSAGAAIMSTTMFRDPPSVLSTLQAGANGLKFGRDIDRGLGFVGEGVFIDQHFVARGRIGRLLPVMMQTNFKLGVAVEEDSGAIFHQGKVEVLGGAAPRTGAVVVDLTDAKADAKIPAFNLRDARVHFLTRGDRFDVKTRTVSPKPNATSERIDPRSPDFKPYHRSVPFYSDVLADGAFVTAIATLIDSKADEARGLAFAPRGERAGLGFEFRFFKTKDSLAYLHRRSAGDETSVFHIGVDVVPVRLATPLYQPLLPSAEPTAAR